MAKENLGKLYVHVYEMIRRHGFRRAVVTSSNGIAHHKLTNTSIGIVTDIWYDPTDPGTLGISFEPELDDYAVLAQTPQNTRRHIQSVLYTYILSACGASDVCGVRKDTLVGIETPQSKWAESFQTIEFYETYLMIEDRFRPNKIPRLIEMFSEKIAHQVVGAAINPF